jgi:hypothetical protein
MAGSFTITISSLSTLAIGGSKRAEAAEISAWVETALQKLVSSELTSIALKDRSGNAAGTMTWVPVNTA